MNAVPNQTWFVDWGCDEGMSLLNPERCLCDNLHTSLDIGCSQHSVHSCYAGVFEGTPPREYNYYIIMYVNKVVYLLWNNFSVTRHIIMLSILSLSVMREGCMKFYTNTNAGTNEGLIIFSRWHHFVPIFNFFSWSLVWNVLTTNVLLCSAYNLQDISLYYFSVDQLWLTKHLWITLKYLLRFVFASFI